DHRVRVWAVDGALLQTFGPFDTPLYALALSPDGQLFAIAGRDGRILIGESHSGTIRHTLIGHIGPVFALNYSPDGRWLASGGEDKVVHLWEVDSGRELRRLSGHGD